MSKVYVEMTVTEPSVVIDDLVSIFMRYGCPEGIAWTLAKDMVIDGRRQMSLLELVDLGALGRDLSNIGVRLRVLSDQI